MIHFTKDVLYMLIQACFTYYFTSDLSFITGNGVVKLRCSALLQLSKTQYCQVASWQRLSSPLSLLYWAVLALKLKTFSSAASAVFI